MNIFKYHFLYCVFLSVTSIRTVKTTKTTTTSDSTDGADSQTTIITSKDQSSYHQTGDGEPVESESHQLTKREITSAGGETVETVTEEIPQDKPADTSEDSDTFKIDSKIDFDPEKQQIAIREKLDSLISGEDVPGGVVTKETVSESHQTTEDGGEVTVVRTQRVTVKTVVSGEGGEEDIAPPTAEDNTEDNQTQIGELEMRCISD